MTRAERIMHLADFLRGRDTTTAAAIAEEFGISERTVFRDLAILRDQGATIVSDTGPGGGIWLKRGTGITSVHMTIEEVVSIWIVSQLSLASSSLPWSSAARSALNKLLASVPAKRARSIRRLCARVIISRPATARVLATAGQPPTELLPKFEQAFSKGISLSFDYLDRFGKKTRRCIEPHGLLVEPPMWYILAYDPDKRGARMFRMDRIRRPFLNPGRSFSPNLETLRQIWEEQKK